jgi:hypothetical protein
VLSTGALSTPASPTPPTLLRFRRIGATTFIATRGLAHRSRQTPPQFIAPPLRIVVRGTRGVVQPKRPTERVTRPI